MDDEDRARQSPEGSGVLRILTGHWLSVLGSALVTIAGCSWLLLLTLHTSGAAADPYVGILIFLVVPAVFFAGLALIPAGVYLARRRIAAGLASAPDRRVVLRRVALFFGVMTVVNVVIGSQVSYRAVAHMESARFCGESCHIMKPQFVANQRGPHRNVQCVECHVVAGATGFAEAKMNGTRQLVEVTLGTYPKPVPPGLQTGRLVSSAETCERCHSRAVDSGRQLRVLSKFKDDETDTPIQTVLMMNVGGGAAGHTSGIHGMHMGPGVEIRYQAADAQRSTIPWVEYRNTATGETSVYTASGAKSGGKTFVMQCADCHNRPGHTFETPEDGVDGAMVAGRIPASLPFAHKVGIQVISADYANDADAAKKIPDAFAAFYREKYPDLAGQRQKEIGQAGLALTEIRQRNVYPELGVKWGSYPDNLGHMDSPGCFRCHDESHTTAAKKTITQDCNACHQVLAVEETSPDILKTLGLLPGTSSP
jgi:NapC/NirT cytochrome c family, N-terminal region